MRSRHARVTPQATVKQGARWSAHARRFEDDEDPDFEEDEDERAIDDRKEAKRLEREGMARVGLHAAEEEGEDEGEAAEGTGEWNVVQKAML